MVVKKKEQVLHMTKKQSPAAQNNKVTKSHLLMFTGQECTHCHEMYPLLDRLEAEEGLKIKKIEVWHNAVNAKKLAELDKLECGGVPFFYNEKTKKAICGAVPYVKLKAWAQSK